MNHTSKLLKGTAPLLLGVVGIVLTVSPAFANLMLTISVPNAALSGFGGPYASVDIGLTSSTTAQVTFTSESNGGYLYLMGDGGSVALNVNAAAFTVGSLTGTNSISGFTPGPYTQASGHEDGFGIFNLQENSFDGFTHSATEIAFILTNTSGTWGSPSDVLTGNSQGYLAGIHAYACVDPGCSTSSGAVATGYAVDGPLPPPPPPVPEPGTMLLLGSGLSGLALLRRLRARA